MTKLSEIRLAFTDTETTGLDEQKHEIVEIATLIYNPCNDKVEDEWVTKVAPTHIETASSIALRINGYVDNPKAYTKGLKSALIKFNSLVKNCFIVGQNIEFDLKFIHKGMNDFGIKPSFGRHRKLELMSLVWWAIKNTDLEKMSLESLCNHFEISNVGAHTALVDCQRTFEVYKRLLELYT